jgi:hypothetical protein
VITYATDSNLDGSSFLLKFLDNISTRVKSQDFDFFVAEKKVLQLPHFNIKFPSEK